MHNHPHKDVLLKRDPVRLFNINYWPSLLISVRHAGSQLATVGEITVQLVMSLIAEGVAVVGSSSSSRTGTRIGRGARFRDRNTLYVGGAVEAGTVETERLSSHMHMIHQTVDAGGRRT